MKRFYVLFVALFLCIFPTMAFATEPIEEVNSDYVDYMNYDFPEDAVVLYQGEDGVIYQSKEQSDTTALASTYSMVYESTWINAGKYQTGNFSIQNPHTIINKTQGTFKIESEYSGATAQMVLHSGISLLANKTLKASDGEVHFEFQSHAKDLVITYYVQKISSNHGMRLMCWLW